MAGYDWDEGKSNNAVSAEEQGLLTLAQIKAPALAAAGITLPVAFARWLAKNEYWPAAEWHHTSSFFNQTNYFDLATLQQIVDSGTPFGGLTLDFLQGVWKREVAEAKKPAQWQSAIGKFAHFEDRKFVAELEIDGKTNGKKWVSKCKTYTKLLSGRNFQMRLGTLAAERKEARELGRREKRRLLANARRAGTTPVRIAKMESVARRQMAIHRGCTPEVFAKFTAEFKGFELVVSTTEQADVAQLFTSRSGKIYGCRQVK